VDTHVHYIYAGDQPVAIYKSHESSAEETLYLHRDHLGSVVEITDEARTLVESLAYDAFGKRREPADWDPPTSPIYANETPRGYTGHEHLDDVGIVHMNGRVYDPELGRMLSADPYVQFAGDSQSYNRYSYVLNNPLSLTDPSGFCVAAGPACPSSGFGSFAGGLAGLGAAVTPAPGRGFTWSVVTRVSTIGVFNWLGGISGGISRPSSTRMCIVAGCFTDGGNGEFGNLDDGSRWWSGSGFSYMSFLYSSESYYITGPSYNPNNSQASANMAVYFARPAGGGYSQALEENGNPGLGAASLDLLQVVIGFGGQVPGLGEIADGANAGISAWRGDYLGAALDASAMIPLAGNVTGSINIARRGARVGQYVASQAAAVRSAAARVGQAVASAGSTARDIAGRGVERVRSLFGSCGGMLNGERLVAGQVGTATDEKESEEIFALFSKAIRSKFEKIQSYYVGPDAARLLDKGVRLTPGAKSPEAYDLARKIAS
jgi:RHS repeat-associated protein